MTAISSALASPRAMFRMCRKRPRRRASSSFWVADDCEREGAFRTIRTEGPIWRATSSVTPFVDNDSVEVGDQAREPVFAGQCLHGGPHDLRIVLVRSALRPARPLPLQTREDDGLAAHGRQGDQT